MQVAQRLYEQGWITYMRTDSTTLSDEALTAARAQARALYGDDYVPDAPRRYERKVKNAQEAHEAIRPAGETFRTPTRPAAVAVGRRAPPVRADLEAHGGLPDDRRHRDQRPGPADRPRCPTATAPGPARPSSRPAGKVIAFPGFLRAYVEGEDDPEAELADREVAPARRWPRATRSRCSAFEPGSHATQPPARYTEASLVKAMEELGVGRPSTYASVIATILDRGYVWKKGTALVPVASPPSPWSGCSSATSPTWSTTASPPRWRTTSTRSPRAARRRCPG